MFYVRIRDSKFVIVQCDDEMKPIKYVDDILVTIGGSNRIEVLLTSDIKGALRFEDAESVLEALALVKSEIDSDIVDNFTIGRVCGNDDVLCLYN